MAPPPERRGPRASVAAVPTLDDALSIGLDTDTVRPMPDTPNPLNGLTDTDLWNTQIVLGLACGRARNALKSHQRTRICFLFNLLQIEATNRGKPSPAAPFSASQQKL